jgi:hypothetical protein
MIVEVELYITKNYYKLLGVAKKYTKNDDWASELLHEVILQLYNKKELKLKIDDQSIFSYIIRMLMVNWCYPSSPFYRRYKKDMRHQVDLTEAIEMTVDETNLDSHRILELIEIEWLETNWFNKIIFEKYMVLGSMKKVAIDTTIPLSSIGKYIKETKETIRTNTIKKFEKE